MNDYVVISSCETNVGVKILIKLPQGTYCSNDLENKIKNIGYSLFIELDQYVTANDADEIANAKYEIDQLILLFGSPIFVEKIMNGYDCCSSRPWLIVTTKIGRIKIGWRKRVIQIDWSDSINHVKSDVLFASEDVTKENCLIHAWSYQKAKEYLEKIIG